MVFSNDREQARATKFKEILDQAASELNIRVGGSVSVYYNRHLITTHEFRWHDHQDKHTLLPKQRDQLVDEVKGIEDVVTEYVKLHPNPVAFDFASLVIAVEKRCPLIYNIA